MAKFPAAFEDSTGRIQRLTGELDYLPDPGATPGDVLTVQADGSIAAAPGGGGATVQAQYSGSPVTATNGGTGVLTWDSLDDGTDLLDRTVPDAPLFLAAGTYAITVSSYPSGMTVGGYWTLVVQTGSGPSARSQGGDNTDAASASMTAIVAAGDTLSAYVGNFDGAVSRDFVLAQATIVKLA